MQLNICKRNEQVQTTQEPRPAFVGVASTEQIFNNDSQVFPNPLQAKQKSSIFPTHSQAKSIAPLSPFHNQ